MPTLYHGISTCGVVSIQGRGPSQEAIFDNLRVLPADADNLYFDIRWTEAGKTLHGGLRICLTSIAIADWCTDNVWQLEGIDPFDKKSGISIKYNSNDRTGTVVVRKKPRRIFEEERPGDIAVFNGPTREKMFDQMRLRHLAGNLGSLPIDLATPKAPISSREHIYILGMERMDRSEYCRKWFVWGLMLGGHSKTTHCRFAMHYDSERGIGSLKWTRVKCL